MSKRFICVFRETDNVNADLSLNKAIGEWLDEIDAEVVSVSVGCTGGFDSSDAMFVPSIVVAVIAEER